MNIIDQMKTLIEKAQSGELDAELKTPKLCEIAGRTTGKVLGSVVNFTIHPIIGTGKTVSGVGEFFKGVGESMTYVSMDYKAIVEERREERKKRKFRVEDLSPEEQEEINASVSV